jgi:F0F1-type ATP synthase membrane subunit a
MKNKLLFLYIFLKNKKGLAYKVEKKDTSQTPTSMFSFHIRMVLQGVFWVTIFGAKYGYPNSFIQYY